MMFKSVSSCLCRVILVSGTVLLIVSQASADSSAEIAELKNRIQLLEEKQSKETLNLKEKTDTLAQEVEATKLGQLLPEKAELKSEWGFGPAASSIYHLKKGLSLGAYGEANYRNFVDDEGSKKDQTDMLRLVTYMGYKFNDNILFNSELEFEHGNIDATGGDSGEQEGEVAVEFAYFDFMFDPAFNARVGLVLIPMGFVNEIHEPPFFHGVLRPNVEQVIIPSTWRENGLGFFGEFDLAGKLEYRTYLVNGLRASRFSDSGIRSGRQSGNRALIEDIAWTSRLDYSPESLSGMLVGVSTWWGNSGQDEVFDGQTPSVGTFLWDAHAQYRISGLELRALGAWGYLDDADILSRELETTIPEEFNGWYVEAAYDVLPLFASGTTQYLAPFFRYESFDTQSKVPDGFTANESLEKQVYTFGLTYKPIPNVALKLDYRNFETDGSSKTADEVAFGIGFAL